MRGLKQRFDEAAPARLPEGVGHGEGLIGVSQPGGE